jgi:hypothetical protein
VRTCAEALLEHGLTGEQLLGLSRKAASDALRRKGAFLDPDRFDDLASYMLEVGVRYAARYEPGHGIGISTFLYRRMRSRYVDWCRATLGDTRNVSNRRIPPGRLFPFNELIDSAVFDPGYDEAGTPFEAAAVLATELDPSCGWTLVHIAGPLASGWQLKEAAAAAGITHPQAQRLLDELQDELADRSPVPSSRPERWSRAKRPKALAWTGGPVRSQMPRDA